MGIVTPGSRLGNIDTCISGEGTYVCDHYIYASIVGNQIIKKNDNLMSNEIKDIIEVKSKNRKNASKLVLHEDDIVICKVIKINIRQVILDIICVGEYLLRETFPGVIHREDVRMNDIDKVVISELFQPNQVVRAAVRSMGDSKSYFLSTAKPGLGVIVKNETG